MADLVSFSASGFSPFLRQMRIRNGVAKHTLAAPATLTSRSANLLDIDVGGATKVVTLPAEADSEGLFFFVYNSSGAGEDIDLQDPAAATVATIGPGLTCLAACDGSTWYKLMLTT
jgi:hypothetical protein